MKGYLPSLYSNASVSAIRLIWREAVLHAKWHEVKRNPDPPTSRSDLQGLLQSALDLQDEFQSWETTIPSAWGYQMEPNTPEIRSNYDEKWQKLILGCRGAPEEIHSYATLKRCWIWSFYRTSRIFLLRDLLEILNWMFKLPEPDSRAVRMNSSHEAFETPTTSSKPITPCLENMALCRYHSSATVHLVNIIEKCCSGIIGNFTVPIYSKSYEDIVGMRGYICFWTLGTMDAVLGAGLVPDSMTPTNPHSTGHNDSPQVSPSPHAANLQLQDPAIHSMTPHNMQTAIQKPYAIAPQFSELSTLLSPQHYDSDSSPTPPGPFNSTPVISPSASNSTTKKGHIFDSSPAHPYDFPVNSPAIDFDAAKPKKLDVAARREWLNSLLYYIGSELGIEKALYIPLTEGFMQTVKPNVDKILGR